MTAVGERSPRAGRAELLLCLGLVCAVLLVYAQVADHEYVSLDDGIYVSENAVVQQGLSREGLELAFGGTHAGNWHPLTTLSHMLDVELFGLHAGAQLGVNVGLHALSVLLLFAFLRGTTGSPWPSALAAGLFALHPLHVESVAWVSGRKDVLSGLFALLTLVAWARYARAPGVARYLPVLALLALGLMAKPMLVTLPFALLLLDYWPLQRTETPWSRRVLEKLPLFALSAASIALTWIAQQESGAVASLALVPFEWRVVHVPIAYVAYLWKLVWPVGLACFYPHPATTHPGALSAWLAPAAGASALLMAATGAALRLRRQPYLRVGWLWFLGTLVPVLGLVQVGEQAISDRYLYLPGIGIYVALAWAARDLARRGVHARRAVVALSGGALTLLALASWQQAGTWRDNPTLYEHALAVTRDNYLAHNNLAVALASGEPPQFGAAESHLLEALRLRPWDAEAQYNLGNVYYGVGALEAAELRFSRAIALRPDHARAHNNLGNVLLRRGEPEAATLRYQQALSLDPGLAPARENLDRLRER